MKNRHKNIRSAIAILQSVFLTEGLSETLFNITDHLMIALDHDDISALVEAKRQLRILNLTDTEQAVINGVLTLLESKCT